jgi:hypothetical protein
MVHPSVEYNAFAYGAIGPGTNAYSHEDLAIGGGSKGCRAWGLINNSARLPEYSIQHVECQMKLQSGACGGVGLDSGPFMRGPLVLTSSE